MIPLSPSDRKSDFHDGNIAPELVFERGEWKLLVRSNGRQETWALDAMPSSVTAEEEEDIARLAHTCVKRLLRLGESHDAVREKISAIVRGLAASIILQEGNGAND